MLIVWLRPPPSRLNPDRTGAESKSRNAAISGRTLGCYRSGSKQAAPTRIQNDSGLAQGLAGRCMTD
jgi:hypothetical protein